MARIVIPCILFLFSAVLTRAQYTIRYNTDNGLPSNHVYQVEQSHDGFMWFGTNKGIVKFDGKQFKSFTTTDGLPTNDIWRIEATPDGRIWYFAKSKKLGYIHNDTVYSFRVSHLTQQPRSIMMQKNGVSFLGDDENYHGIYTFQNGHWEMKDFISKDEGGRYAGKWLFLPGLNRIVIDGNGTPAYFENKQGEKIYTFKNLSKEKGEQIDMKQVNRLCYFEEEQLYFATNTNSLSVFNLQDSTVICCRPFQEDDDNVVPEIQQYGEYFQVCRKGEWILVDKQLNILERKTFNEDPSLCQIFKDNFGNFWIASHDHGIVIYTKPALTNKYLFKGKKIQSINYENNLLFVNVFNEGWYILNPETNEKKLIIRNTGKSYEAGYHEGLRQYYFNGNKNFWYGKDIKHIKKVDKIYVKMRAYGTYEANAGAKALFEKKDGYYALNVSCIMELDSSFNVINDEFLLNDKWAFKGAKAMIKHRDKIFVGEDGLYLISDKYELAPGRNPILQATVNTIIPFDDNFMLVGTDGFGAYFYDGAGSVIPIKGTEGFSINKFQITDNSIWMATTNGVHQFTTIGAKYVYSIHNAIYDEDGLNENNVNSICLLGNQLFVAQDNGLVKISLDKAHYTKSVIPYLITNDNYDKTTNTCTIEYGNNITLSFGVLTMPSQKYVKYYYKTNYKDNWTPTSTTELTMGKQNPGNYEISFKAVDQHGNSGETYVKLTVRPLWYQTTTAKIIAVLAILLIVILITLLIRKRVENKKRAELLLNKTMADLELKALRSQMNPHFVFNSLNAIQYFVIKNKTELSEEYLAKFAKLVRLFFEYSKYESLTVTQEVDLLSRYLEIEKLRFEDKLEYTIVVDEEIDQDDTDIPSMILQPIVENAVNHGIFHKKGNGHVSVIFKKISPTSISIKVIDDGVGILAMKEIQKDNPKSYKSNSSEIVKERLKILSENKMSKWNVTYKISDRSKENTNETGTLVEILIGYTQ